MTTSTSNEIRAAVRQAYGKVAAGTAGSGCRVGSTCCAPAQTASRALGYTEEELTSVPEGASLGLGCGNPLAIALEDTVQGSATCCESVLLETSCPPEDKQGAACRPLRPARAVAATPGKPWAEAGARRRTQ